MDKKTDEFRTIASHLPRPTAWLVQLVGQHLKEGDVQEGSTGDTLNMLLCLGKKSRSLLRQQKGQSVSTWSILTVGFMSVLHLESTCQINVASVLAYLNAAEDKLLI